MSSRMFSIEEKTKLTHLITEGITVLTEIEDLGAGLSETIGAIAEELDIKASLLKKAIRIAQKSKFGETNTDHELLTDILETAGRTL